MATYHKLIWIILKTKWKWGEKWWEMRSQVGSAATTSLSWEQQNSAPGTAPKCLPALCSWHLPGNPIPFPCRSLGLCTLIGEHRRTGSAQSPPCCGVTPPGALLLWAHPSLCCDGHHRAVPWAGQYSPTINWVTPTFFLLLHSQLTAEIHLLLPAVCDLAGPALFDLITSTRVEITQVLCYAVTCLWIEDASQDCISRAFN